MYDYDAFGGEYKDDETGGIYLRARYYDPVIGRFTQQEFSVWCFNKACEWTGHC